MIIFRISTILFLSYTVITSQISRYTGKLSDNFANSSLANDISTIRPVINNQAKISFQRYFKSKLISKHLPEQNWQLPHKYLARNNHLAIQSSQIGGNKTKLTLTSNDVETLKPGIPTFQNIEDHEYEAPASVSIISQEIIQNLPIRDFTSYLKIQPGVVLHNDNIHVRGGRSDETAYLLNGTNALNALDYSNAVYIIPEAISEIQVHRGGFSAQYGLATSGLVMTELRQAPEKLQLQLNVQSDKFAKSGGQFLNTYSYREHISTLLAGGPLIKNYLKFFLALENHEMGESSKSLVSRGTCHLILS
jgi:hypothetical protein